MGSAFEKQECLAARWTGKNKALCGLRRINLSLESKSYRWPLAAIGAEFKHRVHGEQTYKVRLNHPPEPSRHAVYTVFRFCANRR